jgi:hypothetical protein
MMNRHEWQGIVGFQGLADVDRAEVESLAALCKQMRAHFMERKFRWKRTKRCRCGIM